MSKVMTIGEMEHILSTEIPFDELEKDAGILEFYEDGAVSIGISCEDSTETGKEIYIFNLFAYDKDNIIGYGEGGTPQFASEYVNIEGEYLRGEIPSTALTELLMKRWNTAAHRDTVKLYRYELFCDEEPQDVGFLVGLEDLGLSAETEKNLLEPFDSMLDIPDSPHMRGAASFFTEEGNSVFRPHILRIAAAFEGSIFDLKVCTLELPGQFLDSVVYQDDYQVCLPRQLYQNELNDLVIREYFPLEEFHDGPFKVINPFLVGDLFHVGTMDISQKRSFSYEGNGLSVSNCPDSWRRITQGFTCGDCFHLTKQNMKLLDFYALTDEEKGIIQDWAIENGYAEEGTLFKSISWDAEGCEFYSLFRIYEEALTEADEGEDRVQPIPGLLPTQKLLDQSMVKVELLDIFDLVAALYAEQVLDYDGIYWDEALDEAAYSAPRGVIFNNKLPTFDVKTVTKDREAKPRVEQLISDAYLQTSQIRSKYDLQPIGQKERE